MSKLVEFKVSFRICDDKLNPLEITELLGITPDLAHRKGDPNASISKKGKLIVYSPFSTGLWSIHAKEESNTDLEQQIKSLLSVLYPLKDSLLKLSRRGYKMDIFCGAFTDASVFGFEIKPDTLLWLGELNIKLGLDIYTH